MPRSAEDIERDASGLREQFVSRWRLLSRAQREVETLFCDNGKPTAAAVAWLDRLAAKNFINSTTFHDDAREHARREGKRELALEIIASVGLDPRRLERLSEQMREIDHE